MPRILLVDNDASFFADAEAGLRRAGCAPVLATTGREALRLAAADPPHIAFVELMLPDMSGLDVIRGLRRESPATACVLLTGTGTFRAAADARRLGAAALAAKPLTLDELVEIIHQVLQRDAAMTRECAPHALQRWAALISGTLALAEDPRTLGEWGRALGVSTGALRNWCRTARLVPRRSLLFARVLRALHLKTSAVRAEDLLNIADRRSLVKLLRSSGSAGSRLPPSVGEFLDAQRLIADRSAVAHIRRELQYVGSGPVESHLGRVAAR